ncbi:WecB/TagA/CpsF family glycosyltransferase [Oscillatoriales cyanobacterium LEGE 11467]|uniref:WecB/TagA/CpsF family glycosyltransferase n=1 Tax=Zarconia navalis LEGE 11467 TaxID=1828826 RepID=A0A928VXJ5_9CYAN|nr:WecB/TagA/CpsF family glycosyltransferase [Zarconia navalis]MBE9040592.1 WecB/TagA/CpsF family glycosyltransferase [Zarconia navalis LEGE 11467]
MVEKVKILNIEIDNFTMKEFLKNLYHRGGIVFTPNVDHLVKLQKDRDFNRTYQASNYRVCDSKVLMYASKFLGTPIREKISGSDLFPEFYNYCKRKEEKQEEKDTKIFLLGAAEGVALKAQENINQKVGWEIIVDAYSPSFGFERNELECQKIIDRINESGATVLAIGVGAPKQENWLAKYHGRLKNIKTFLAIGATIDFEAGEKPRSPQWMSDWGLEWLYRLQSEPQRLWKRYLVDDLPFFWLLLQQKLDLYQPPFQPPFSPEPVAAGVPLGQILQDAGLISDKQVALALKCQQTQEDGLRFGDILVNRGWLAPETIDFFAEDLPQVANSGRLQPLGHYLKRAKLLNDRQINEILSEQSQANLRFGEVAVRKGWVKEETIKSVLRYLEGKDSFEGAALASA